MSNSQKIVKILFSGDRLNVTLGQPHNGPLLQKKAFEDEVERITEDLDPDSFKVVWFAT